jgi:transcriptional regulator with XRE-family HTH domain
MKNFDFAKKLCELRMSQGLSQKELAEMLQISNKAVSKWENADAKPSIEILIQLSKIFNTSIDDMLSIKKTDKKQIYKITITGGPCSGKSTAMSWLQTEFNKKGYMVLFVPETASELILGGVSPWTVDGNKNFESYILRLQLQKEQLYEEAARPFRSYRCGRGHRSRRGRFRSYHAFLFQREEGLQES